MSSKRRGPRPPEHLSAEAKRWWSSTLKNFELEEHHVKLLTLAAETWDRAQEARRRIAEDGTYVLDRWGCVKSHPAVNVERDAKTIFARLVRELALDVSEPGDNRPPGIGGNANLRR